MNENWFWFCTIDHRTINNKHRCSITGTKTFDWDFFSKDFRSMTMIMIEKKNSTEVRKNLAKFRLSLFERFQSESFDVPIWPKFKAGKSSERSWLNEDNCKISSSQWRKTFVKFFHTSLQVSRRFFSHQDPAFFEKILKSKVFIPCRI